MIVNNVIQRYDWRERNAIDYTPCNLEIGDFTLSSGEKSSFYYDAYHQIMNEPYKTGWHFNSRITSNTKNTNNILLCAIEMGGALLLQNILTFSLFYLPHQTEYYRRKIFPIILRKEDRLHGLKDTIIGNVPQNIDYVMVLDDVLTTGKSVLRAQRIMKEQYDKDVNGICVVMDRSPSTKNKIELDIPVFSMYNTTEDTEAEIEKIKKEIENEQCNIQ